MEIGKTLHHKVLLRCLLLLLGRWLVSKTVLHQESAFKITQDGAPLRKELNPVNLLSGFVGGGGHHIPPGSLPHRSASVSSKTGASASQSCESFFVIKSHWPSMSDSLGFPVPLLDPQAGKPDVGFRTFVQKWENLFGIVLQSVGSPTRWV